MMDYIRQLLYLVFAISVMYILLDCEVKLKKHRFAVCLYATAVLICDAFVLYKLGYNHFMTLYPLLVHLPVFLAFVFVSSFKPVKVLFVLCTVIAITATFTSAGLVASYFFGPSRAILNIVCYILLLPAWLVIYRMMRPSFLYMMRNSDKGWFGFCIIPLSYAFLLYFTGMYYKNSVVVGSTVRNYALLFVLIFSAYYVILRHFKQTREKLALQNEQDLLITHVSAAKMHLETLKDSQEKTIIYRHDMRHHLNMICAFLSDNNKDAAQKYITEVSDAIEGAVFEKYCGNYTVNLILSSYIAKAKNNEISVKTQIDLPEKNTVSDMDLCVIFANAIENAINACKRMVLKEDRVINIICKNKSDNLFIQITNSYEGSVDFVGGMPVSTIENHGLGIKSIVAVAQKYGGLYSFTAEKGLFSTSIILQSQ